MKAEEVRRRMEAKGSLRESDDDEEAMMLTAKREGNERSYAMTKPEHRDKINIRHGLNRNPLRPSDILPNSWCCFCRYDLPHSNEKLWLSFRPSLLVVALICPVPQELLRQTFNFIACVIATYHATMTRTALLVGLNQQKWLKQCIPPQLRIMQGTTINTRRHHSRPHSSLPSYH